MPPISPDPGPVPNNTIPRVTATDRATGSLRVQRGTEVVSADPVHDPILWYDVCVDVIGEIHLPGDAIFGDGAVRGTDLCGDRTTLALTADTTDEPYIDLTGALDRRPLRDGHPGQPRRAGLHAEHGSRRLRADGDHLPGDL